MKNNNLIIFRKPAWFFYNTKICKLLFIVFLSTYLINPVFTQTADSLWNSGISKLEAEDYHGVIADMDKLTKLAPDFHTAIYNKGIARLMLADETGACKDLSYFDSLNPDVYSDFISYLCDSEMIRDLVIEQFYPETELFSILGYRPLYTRADSLRGALRPERTAFDVNYYDITVKINPARKTIEGTTGVGFIVTDNCLNIQLDLFSIYKISEITWNNINLNYRREYDAIFIEFPYQLQKGEYHYIEITYSGTPPEAPNPPWQGGFVWESDYTGNHWTGVACEHLGASSWWPNKDHLSDKADSVSINIIAPRNYQIVSNGNLRGVSNSGLGYEKHSWFVSYPINNYNISFKRILTTCNRKNQHEKNQ